MGYETNGLDAAADGQFSGRICPDVTESGRTPDPADTLTKRGGKGHVYFEGVSYTRLAWIRRSARLGHTLAAGEGAVLDAELERVTAMVEQAYREGYGDGATLLPTDAEDSPDESWRHSDAYWLLHGEEE